MQTSTGTLTDAITVLMEEHRLIERVLTALERCLERGDSARSDLPRFVEFIRDFADAQHHGKEEGVLFTAMAEAGFPTDGGPIAVMLHEHDLGRQYVAQIADPKSDGVAAGRAARGYAELLRQHIQKEDQILYPMAREVLGRELEVVGHRCAELDATAASRRYELERLAEELIRQYR